MGHSNLINARNYLHGWVRQTISESNYITRKRRLATSLFNWGGGGGGFTVFPPSTTTTFIPAHHPFDPSHLLNFYIAFKPTCANFFIRQYSFFLLACNMYMSICHLSRHQTLTIISSPTNSSSSFSFSIPSNQNLFKQTWHKSKVCI